MLNKLPLEILEYIFNFLTLNEDKVSLNSLNSLLEIYPKKVKLNIIIFNKNDTFMILYSLCKSGYFYLLKYFIENLKIDKSFITCKLINIASSKGHLKIVKYLSKINSNVISNVSNRSKRAMDWASANGHLNIVKYLHSIGKDCSLIAMNLASANGHLEIVKYLHSIGKTCGTYAIEQASYNGHLDVVKYLHSIIGKNITKYSIDNARYNNHLEILNYLLLENKK